MRTKIVLDESQRLGNADHAVPYLAATAFNAYLLTAAPDRYPNGDRVIDISDN